MAPLTAPRGRSSADARGAEYRVVEIAERVVVLELIGEHDLATMGEIGETLRLLARTNDLLVIDLARATFVDSTVLQTLVEAQRSARRVGAKVRVRLGEARIVAKAFELSGLIAYLDTCGTLDEALRGFAP